MWITLKNFVQTKNARYSKRKIEKIIRQGQFQVNDMIITDINYPLECGDNVVRTYRSFGCKNKDAWIVDGIFL